MFSSILQLVAGRGLDSYFGHRIPDHAPERLEMAMRCLTGITAGMDPNAIYNAQTEVYYGLGVLNRLAGRLEKAASTPQELDFSELKPLIRRRAAFLVDAAEQAAEI